MRIAFVASMPAEIHIIKQQIKDKNISNINVLAPGSDTTEYDLVEYNVHPNKDHAELLDLAQCTSRFGFHTTPFSPIEKSGDSDLDRTKKFLSDSEMELKHLAQTLPDDDDGLQEFDFEKYTLSIQKLEKKEKQLLEKQNNISNWTMKELASAYEYTDSIQTVISIGAEIYTRKFGSPVSKRGYPYEYDPIWISEGVLVAFSKYPEKKRQWLKAYKTRCRNIIKQEKNFNSLKFFIDWLVERYESELITYSSDSDDDSTPQNQSYGASQIEIDPSEIPF